MDIVPHSVCLRSGDDVTTGCATLMMTLQLTWQSDARVKKLCNPSDIDYINGAIHDRAFKKYGYAIYLLYINFMILWAIR